MWSPPSSPVLCSLWKEKGAQKIAVKFFSQPCLHGQQNLLCTASRHKQVEKSSFLACVSLSESLTWSKRESTWRDQLLAPAKKSSFLKENGGKQRGRQSLCTQEYLGKNLACLLLTSIHETRKDEEKLSMSIQVVNYTSSLHSSSFLTFGPQE